MIFMLIGLFAYSAYWVWRISPFRVTSIVLLVILWGYICHNSITAPIMESMGFTTGYTVKIIDSRIEWRGEERVAIVKLHNTSDIYMQRLELDCPDGYIFDGTGMSPDEISWRTYRVNNSVNHLGDCSIDFRTGKPKPFSSNKYGMEDRIE